MLIAHLSDPHLCLPGERYNGVLDSNARFAQAVDQARTFSPGLVILSGDLTEHGLPEEYALARDLLARLNAPLLVIPGNHDDRGAFRTALTGLPGLVPFASEGPLHAVAEGPIRIIGLDVTVPGDDHGQIAPAHASWLDAALTAAPDTPTMVMLHQPPFHSGLHFVDDYRCFGEELLAEVLTRHPQVVRILAGHIHRFSLTTFAGRPAVTAPSTATGIALRLQPDAEPASYTEPPAMLLHLWRDGRLVTHLQPLGDHPGPYDFF